MSKLDGSVLPASAMPGAAAGGCAAAGGAATGAKPAAAGPAAAGIATGGAPAAAVLKAEAQAVPPAAGCMLPARNVELTGISGMLPCVAGAVRCWCSCSAMLRCVFMTADST